MRTGMHAGPIHFLQYDSETPFVPGSLQYEWILNDLASVDRTKTPWVSGLPGCIAVRSVKVRVWGCSAPNLQTVRAVELHCHCIAALAACRPKAHLPATSDTR
jgi:hypothetical protein